MTIPTRRDDKTDLRVGPPGHLVGQGDLLESPGFAASAAVSFLAMSAKSTWRRDATYDGGSAHGLLRTRCASARSLARRRSSRTDVQALRRAVRWPLLISSDSTARSASVTDGMAVARTRCGLHGGVPLGADARAARWVAGSSDRRLRSHRVCTRVTDWCYQGVTGRSNTDEALTPAPRTLTRPVRPLTCGDVRAASISAVLLSSRLCADSHGRARGQTACEATYAPRFSIACW